VLDEVMKEVSRLLYENRPYMRGIVASVAGAAGAQVASVQLDGATTATPGIPVVKDTTVAEDDYVVVARLAARDLVVLARLPG
jgi:hypothetical protein